METKEVFFTCPYCWKEISFVLDPSADDQTYIEDCENCCHPIQVSYRVEQEEIVDFQPIRIQ